MLDPSQGGASQALKPGGHRLGLFVLGLCDDIWPFDGIMRERTPGFAADVPHAVRDFGRALEPIAWLQRQVSFTDSEAPGFDLLLLLMLPVPLITITVGTLVPITRLARRLIAVRVNGENP